MSHAAESPPSEQQLQRELAILRERLAALERELVEVQAQANRAVADWQERGYWLERWHLDLNALMRRRGAAQARALLRAIRVPLRLAKRAIGALRP